MTLDLQNKVILKMIEKKSHYEVIAGIPTLHLRNRVSQNNLELKSFVES
jgi:hypothetical protein